MEEEVMLRRAIRMESLASVSAALALALLSPIAQAQDSKQLVCSGQSWNPDVAHWGTQCISSSGVDATVAVTNNGDGTSKVGFYVMSHGECNAGSQLVCSFSTTGYDDNRATDGDWEYDWDSYIPMILIVCLCE
jgi:hypothetical protein